MADAADMFRQSLPTADVDTMSPRSLLMADAKDEGPLRKHMDINELRKLNLVKFPLPQGEVLYFCPETLGILEAGDVIGDILEESLTADSQDDLVRHLSGKYPEEYLLSILDTLKTLEEKGIIGIGKEDSCIPSESVIRFIVSNTNACNLSCRYCYNQFGDNRDAFSAAASLNKGQIKRAMELLSGLSGEYDELELLFIGGEPLLRFDLVREAAELRMTMSDMAEKHVRLFLITNATLLNDEIYEYCSENNIHIKISLDGGREIHNKSRIFPDGRGSYDAAISRLPGYFTQYSHPCKAVTATVDSFATELLPMVEHFASMGFNQIELTELYGCNSDCSGMKTEDGLSVVKGDISDKHKETILKNYGELADFLHFRIRSGQYVNLIPFYDPLYFLHNRTKNVYPCRAGIDSAALFSDGKFYPCHHYMGDGDFSFGDLENGLDSKKLRAFTRQVDRREKCKDCWARFVCGGECYHRSMVEGEDIYSGYEKGCFRRKALISEAIYLYHRLKEEDPGIWDWYFSVNLYP